MKNHKRILLLLALGAFGIALGMLAYLPFAHAQGVASMPVQCGLTKDWEADLQGKFKEIVIGAGITPMGNLVRLFQSEHTWAVVFTRPDGTSCTLAAGDDWESIDTTKQGDKT